MSPRASSSCFSDPPAAASPLCSIASPACSTSRTAQIFINGKNVTWEEPKDRGIGMVFQSYALYPQMTVEGNLVVRPEERRHAAGTRSSSASHAPPRSCRSSRCSTASPAQLSGGQRQRVAIGRALVRDVDVFLFDEPLSNLDAKLRSELRVEIKRLHQRLGNTMIYVTHDQIEALTLADRIAVMKGGVIQQLDAPQTIYNRPVNRFVAGFIGSPAMNFIDGEVDAAADRRSRPGSSRCRLQNYAFGNGAWRRRRRALGVRPEHIACRQPPRQADLSRARSRSTSSSRWAPTPWSGPSSAAQTSPSGSSSEKPLSAGRTRHHRLRSCPRLLVRCRDGNRL